MEKTIIMYTDGSSLGNPGPGGWGAIIQDGEIVIELGGREAHTTNNKMELTAVIESLKRLKDKKANLLIHTDSRYVINGITKWLSEWKKRGWMTKQKKPVENRDLWEKLSFLVDEHSAMGMISWEHVGGHVGIPGNERADQIATSFAEEKKPALYEGSASGYSHDLNTSKASKKKSASRSASKARSRAKAYSYVSLVNGILKKHATWEECEKRVRGISGAKFKKALSADDERAIQKVWGLPERPRSQSGV